VIGIFGVSLNTSIQYAYVNISITNASGNPEVYGRIPIIVAKCGVFLKEKGLILLKRSTS
jgi:GTPase-activating protein SAC7